MSWTDKKSLEHIKKIRDIFKVDVFIETGTYVGINALFQSKNFKKVITCEKVNEYYKKALKRLGKYENILTYNEDSSEFLKWLFKGDRLKTFTNNIPILYCDAHFYVKGCKDNLERFVVLKELKALKNTNCIIIIHDFDNNCGHITYDDISLDMELLKKDLLKVNSKFHFYTNELKSCDILTLDEATKLYVDRLIDDNTYREMINNLKYAWSKPDKTYRGILYCLPKKVNIEGLREIK